MLLVGAIGFVTLSFADLRASATASALVQEASAPCPGEQMGVQATGVYNNQPVPEIVINGAPWSGGDWAPGHRSYWHCHAGGQLMMVWEGEGRVQRRGERMRVLAERETHVVGPGEEHWHGASPHTNAHYVQVSFQPAGTYWMEEVSRDDYMGNETGITSRNEFLRTGVREQENP